MAEDVNWMAHFSRQFTTFTFSHFTLLSFCTIICLLVGLGHFLFDFPDRRESKFLRFPVAKITN